MYGISSRRLSGGSPLFILANMRNAITAHIMAVIITKL